MMEQPGERCSTTFNGARTNTTKTGRQTWPEKDKKDKNITNNFDDYNWIFEESNNMDESAKHDDRNDESSTNDFNWVFGKGSDNTHESAKHNDKKDESSIKDFNWIFGTNGPNKTRRNDKTHLPYDKANIATNIGDVNDDTKYDQRVEMSSTTLTGARPRTRTNDKTHFPYDKANIATNKNDVNDDTKYDLGVEMSSRTLTEARPKTRRNDKTHLPYDKANIATNKSDVNDDTKYDQRVEMSSRTLTGARPRTRRNDKTHLPYDKATIATNKSDVNDDRKYDQRGEMSSPTLTGARPKTRRNDTNCISGNEAYVKNTSAGRRGDGTNTKKNDIKQERFVEIDESAVNNGKNYGLGRDMTKTKKKVTRQDCFVVMTMNTNGENKERLKKPQDKRRQVVQMLLESYTPDIMFFQEFQSRDIYGRVWSNHEISANYAFHGNKEVSLLVDTKQLDVHSRVDGENIDTELRRILEKSQRSNTDESNVTLPIEFTPLPRMRMYCIHLKDGTMRKLLCASWHGLWNNITKKGRIELFSCLMKFLRKVIEKFKLPLIIGGDFNIDILDVKGMVNDPFSLATYDASKRRKGKEKDFFIVSKDLRLENIQCIDYKEDAHFSAIRKEFHPNDILDHDPIKASLKFA